MSDTDRIIGELKEFKRVAISRLDMLEIKVEALSHWRWKITGGLAVVIAFAELANIMLKG